jgi:hypothetical protein
MEIQVEVDDYFLVLEDWCGIRGCWEVAKAMDYLEHQSKLQMQSALLE